MLFGQATIGCRARVLQSAVIVFGLVPSIVFLVLIEESTQPSAVLILLQMGSLALSLIVYLFRSWRESARAH